MGYVMDYNRKHDAKVDEIVAQLRKLNGLDEKTINVQWGSWSEIAYAGNINNLILPEGYYASVYSERGENVPCITNKGNTGDNSFWTFLVKP